MAITRDRLGRFASNGSTTQERRSWSKDKRKVMAEAIRGARSFKNDVYKSELVKTDAFLRKPKQLKSNLVAVINQRGNENAASSLSPKAFTKINKDTYHRVDGMIAKVTSDGKSVGLYKPGKNSSKGNTKSKR